MAKSEILYVTRELIRINIWEGIYCILVSWWRNESQMKVVFKVVFLRIMEQIE